MDHFHKLDGRCNCGNIRFRYYSPDALANIVPRACKCRACTKHGGRWVSHHGGILVAEVFDEELVRLVQFCNSESDFYVCHACHVAPFVLCRNETVPHAVLNANTLDDFCAADCHTHYHDYSSEPTDRRNARRAVEWINNVTLTFPSIHETTEETWALSHV